MNAYNRGAQPPGQETGPASARWSLLGGIDPDDTKTAPQPAVRTRRAAPGRLPARPADPDDTKTAPQPAIRIPHPPEARPAPANVPPRSDPAPPVARPAPRYDDGVVPGMRRRAAADPSWLRVLVTTVGLWLQRRSPGGRVIPRRRVNWSYWLRAAALALVVLVAAGAGVVLSRRGHTHKPSAASQVRSAQAVRVEAAKWVHVNVSPAVDVFCDSVMCRMLSAQHFPYASLLQMGSGSQAQDPLGTQVVVATEAVRSQFGAKLDSVYAPLTLARFGSGSDEIDIRQMFIGDSAASYLRAVTNDVTARRAVGAELAARRGLAATPAVRHDLTAGLVDPRLLGVLPTLSDMHPLRIVSFGAAAPGASPGIPLRTVTIEAGLTPAGNTTAALGVLARFLNQQQEYRPASTLIVRLPTGGYALRVQYYAPTPLGLINTTQSEAGGDTRSPSH